MASFTENYQLKKPDDEDYFNIADVNGNMDMVDAELHQLAAALGNAANQPALESLIATIGETNHTGGTDSAGSVMAKLNAIQKKIPLIPTSIIKSVQKGIFTQNSSASSTISIPVNAVNPSKCFVLLDFYSSLSTNMGCCLSSLSSSYLTIYTSMQSERNYLSWQVVEFY